MRSQLATFTVRRSFRNERGLLDKIKRTIASDTAKTFGKVTLATIVIGAIGYVSYMRGYRQGWIEGYIEGWLDGISRATSYRPTL